MALLGGPQVLLNGIIAQVDRAKKAGEERGQDWKDKQELRNKKYWTEILL